MRGSGRVVFVGALLLLAGTINLIYGIGAVSDARVLVNDQRFIFSNLHAYGWTLIILAIIQFTGGLSLLRGNVYGRVIGVIGAGLGALHALVAVGGSDPWWSLGLFVLCLWILYGILMFGEDVNEQRSY
jgi:hypothetical protein